MENHIVYFKNNKEEHFKIEVFDKEHLDSFLDQLNIVNEDLTYLDNIEFKNPMEIIVTDEEDNDIGILTHETELLTEK